jgi:glycosyltransferase involved in cell wall biosynthesis
MTDPRPYLKLRIGIDARAATEVVAGRGRFVRELLAALPGLDAPHTYVCFARRRWVGPAADALQWHLIDAPDPLWHLRCARDASRICDVFLSSNSYLTVPLLHIPSVAIVYDLITFHRAMRPRLRSAVIERLTLGTAVRRATRLICVSRATREDLVSRFPAASSKATVALLGASRPAARIDPEQRADLPSPGFVLAVGTLEPRKNLPRLVAAFERLPERLQDAHPLVVVGPRGWRTGEAVAALKRLGGRCRMLGSVSDEILWELYLRCEVFCYPSLGEGFGLPVLEAMTAGAPVLTSRLSSLPEVGGDAVAYVDPASVSSIANGLEALLSSSQWRQELRRRGPERARNFDWNHTARLVLDALEAAVDSPRGDA